MRSASLASAALLLGGCVARVDTRGQGAPDERQVVVRALAYDAAGAPTVPAPLAERPSRRGDIFTVARLRGGKLDASFDVAVLDERADFERPLSAVYEWTGAGLTWGLNLSGELLRGDAGVVGGPRSGGSAEAAFLVAVVAAPTVLGTVGGAVVGLAQGARLTAEELGKVVRKHETLVSYTEYSYDALGRLALARVFSAADGREAGRTEYAYDGDSPAPVRAAHAKAPAGGSR